AVDVPGVPANGQAIAVYAGRVWIAQGRAITFSGPNDYSAASWSVALGSGTVLIADETLTGNLVRLIPSAGYLYVIGPSSVDVISNVYVPAGATPPTPLFNRQNISSTVGTPYPMAAFGFDRNIGIVNQYGIYVVSGVQTQRISQEIDDIITSLEWNAPLAQVSCSVAVSNEIPVLNFLVSWHDPDAPTTLRQTILCWSDGKWWLYDPFGLSGISGGVIAAIAPAFQGNTLRTYIIANTASGSNSVMSVYVAYDGTSTALVPVVLKSALTDFGSSIWTKQALKLGIEGNVQDANSLVTATCDNEIVAGIPQTYLPKVFKWINGSGMPFTWYNAAGQLFTWVVGGYAYAMKDVQTYGRYLGLSLSGT
ncbi:MAG: hypothetical protein IRY96_10525, partial [Burkholderiales bacterium]|nr:hypothetical protein [Burkholderiales bacterium]